MASTVISASRRTVLAGVGGLSLAAVGRRALGQSSLRWKDTVEIWGMQEIVLSSDRIYGNPFADVNLHAAFSNGKYTIQVDGFHDGDGIWKIRFMPQHPGRWSFKTSSNDDKLNGISGKFAVHQASKDNHGPVHPAKTYHFSYTDGTPYFLLGTTSYNWLNREQALQDESLRTISKSAFTKWRFGLFPKWYVYNRVEPIVFPFVRKADGTFDLDRFDPRFFANVEMRMGQLQHAGIEADVILFHPYDKWGFAKMDEAHNKNYLEYVVARLAAFRNVWWTMANEFDLMTDRNWDLLTQVVHTADPYSHPLSTHPCARWYDYSKPYIDHATVQDGGAATARTGRIARQRYRKPVVMDEYGYEGDNNMGWGDLTGFEEMQRHWELTMAGCYASHGETYVRPGGIQWWAAGGELVGQSPARLGFLKKVMTTLPYQEMEPSPGIVVNGTALAKPGQAYLFRFAKDTKKQFFPSPYQVRLTGADRFDVQLIDPWCMKVYPLGVTTAGDYAFFMPLSIGLLRITAAVQSEATPKSIGALLADFAGEQNSAENEIKWESKLDPSLFKVEPLHYSTDFQILQLLQNPAAKAVLEKHLPDMKWSGILGALPLDLLSKLPSFPGMHLAHVSEADLQAIGAELEKIEVD